MVCPRCTGCVVTQGEDTRCVNCGWYRVDPLEEVLASSPASGPASRIVGTQMERRA